jgi:hypothetical protein
MTRAIGVVGVMIITALCSFGQPAPATPAFEAASVKAAAPSTNGMIGRSFGGDAGRIDYENVTLKGFIMWAYGIKEYQITGPDWLDLCGYDIVATIPHDATETRLPQSPNGRHIEGKSRLAGLCDFLSRTTDRPVVDITDWKGVYDMTLDWAPDDSERIGVTKMVTEGTFSPGAGGPPRGVIGKGPENMPDTTGGATLFTALQDGGGLKLEQRKTPADFLIVDRAEKVPVED